MEIIFRASASKHGITHERSRHVVEHCARPLYPSSAGDDLVLFLGPDPKGVPLEVVAVERAGGGYVVIHAMRLRPRYAAEFAEEMRCR
jgi:hypothetical protein